MGKPESLGVLSEKWVEKVKTLAWPNGAILTCPVCFRRKAKTPEEMEQYLKRWPKCCGQPADVRPI